MLYLDLTYRQDTDRWVASAIYNRTDYNYTGCKGRHLVQHSKSQKHSARKYSGEDFFLPRFNTNYK